MSSHDVAQRACKKQAGFTLIELLIVIAIIAILAAIAIPMFMKYKQGAYLDSVRSDVKNTVTAMESYDATNGYYPGQTASGAGPVQVTSPMKGPGAFDATGAPVTTGTDGIFNISAGNSISVASDTTCANGYSISGSSSNITTGVGSSGTPVSYDSCSGQYSGF